MSILKTVNVSVVVARKGDKFCVTDEKYGWYLPAGRVDYGESFTTAAVREAQEEAGFEAQLQGILRFEYSVSSKGFFRVRVVFQAKARDESKPLKQVADSETYGAEWFTLDETVALDEGDPDMIDKILHLPRRVAQKKKKIRRYKKKEVMRGSEVWKMFEWTEKGTNVFPLELYYGIDGKDINNSRVEIPTEYFVQVVVRNIKTSEFHVETIALTLDMLEYSVKIIKHAEKLCMDLTKTFMTLVQLEGLCGIYHQAPLTKKKKETAKFTFSFFAEINSEKELDAWNSQKFNAESVEITSDAELAMRNVSKGIVAPLSILAWEGSKHLVLDEL